MTIVVMTRCWICGADIMTGKRCTVCFMKNISPPDENPYDPEIIKKQEENRINMKREYESQFILPNQSSTEPNYGLPYECLIQRVQYDANYQDVYTLGSSSSRPVLCSKTITVDFMIVDVLNININQIYEKLEQRGFYNISISLSADSSVYGGTCTKNI